MKRFGKPSVPEGDDAQLNTWQYIEAVGPGWIERGHVGASVLAGLLTLLWFALAWDFQVDEALVTARYVRNAVAGIGLVWNPEGAVQGFSHPLWALQLLPLVAMGIDPITAARGLGALSFLVALVLVAWMGRHRPGGSVAVLLFGGSLTLAAYALSGLATAQAALWLLAWGLLVQHAGVADLNRKRRIPWSLAAAGGAAALGTLCRPELFLLVPATGIWLWGQRRRLGAATHSLAAAVPLVAWGAYALPTYGSLLPNSFYVRVWQVPLLPKEGALYLLVNAADWAVPLLAALTLLSPPPAWRKLLAWILIPTLLFLVFTGGDPLPLGRLLAPLGVLAVLTALHPEAIPRSDRRQQAIGAGLLLVTLLLPFTRVLPSPRLLDAQLRVVDGEIVGRMLQRYLPPGTLIAAATSGSTPYFAHSMRFVDTLGANDRIVARRPIGAEDVRSPIQRIPGCAKGDGDYVIGRRPEVMIMGFGLGDYAAAEGTALLSEVEMQRNPAFHMSYEVWAVPTEREHSRFHRGGPALKGDEWGRMILYLKRRSPAYDAITKLPGAEEI